MMDPEKLDDGTADASMMSNNSPYQPTTEPVSNRTHLCAGFILNTQYVKSLPGILKLVEVLISIIVLICLGSSICLTSCSGVSFLRGVAVWTIVWTVVLYLCFALCLTTKIPMIHWAGTDLINAAVDCLFFLIASITTAALGGNSGNTAAAVFGFFNAVAYGGSSWLAYRTFVVDRHKRNSNVSHIPGQQE